MWSEPRRILRSRFFPAHLAAELEVGQVPSVDLVRLELEVVRLALEVEEGHELDRVPDGVGHHALPVDAEEAAPEREGATVKAHPPKFTTAGTLERTLSWLFFILRQRS